MAVGVDAVIGGVGAVVVAVVVDVVALDVGVGVGIGGKNRRGTIWYVSSMLAAAVVMFHGRQTSPVGYTELPVTTWASG